MLLKHVHTFESPLAPQGIFDTLFGGLMLLKGIPLIAQLGWLLCVCVACACAPWSGQAVYRRMSLAASTASLVFAWLFLLQPWDEIFINLKHSQNLLTNGRFSFQSTHWIEGTVDFLPYLLVAAWGKLGVGLTEAALLQGFFGTWVCVVVGARLLREWKCALPTAVSYLALCLFPPLLFNSGHGFATAFYLAWILTTIQLLFYSRHPRWGWAALALLPLVRVEGVVLVGLLGGLWCVRQEGGSHRQGKGYGGAVLMLAALAPAIVHAVTRWKVYGHAVPLPVQFKANTGELFFLIVGLRNLAADAVATLAVVGAVGLFTLHRFKVKGLFPPDGLAMLWLLALACLPYYTGGGDWFPSYWGRYLLPFVFWLYLLVLYAAGKALQAEAPPTRQAWALPAVLLLAVSLWPMSSTRKFADEVFQHRRTLARIHEPTIQRGHYRIQHLSQLGSHFKETTRPRDRIGSSELATIMFFAQRDAVDYLGLTEVAIAQSPARPAPSLFRRFPYRSELPFLIFRRLRPDLLSKTQPEFLYTFDFLLRDQLKDTRPYELDAALLWKALARWERQMGGLMEPLYGGLEAILGLGYEPVIVRRGEGFLSLYFVHPSVWGQHGETLRAQGYKANRLVRQAAVAAPSNRVQ